MSIETDLISKITTDVDVSPLIGSRLYSQLGPQDATLPFATYEITNTEQQITLSGPSNYYSTDLQIDSYASSKASVIDLAAKVSTALHGYAGELDSTTVKFARVDSISDVDEAEYAGQAQPKAWHRTIIFKIYWGLNG